MSGNEEAEPLVQKQSQDKRGQHNIYILSGYLMAVLILLCSLILVSVNLSETYKIADQNSNVILAKELPRSFVVSTVGSVRDQGSRGVCWDFATMRFLEERYRVQGVKRGFLKGSEYVRFSEQAHGKTMIDYCRANPHLCPDTPGASGSATDGYPSWIFHFNADLKNKLVVDMASCPFYVEEGNDEDCEGYEEFLQSSKISYKVTNYKSLTTPQEIKQGIFETNSSFPLITELFNELYYIPCDSSLGYTDTDVCTKKETLCPADMQSVNYDRYCAVIGLMTTGDAEFIARRGRIGPTIGAHAMLAVGWSDDYMAPGQSRGGIIVQNSWGPKMSHTARFFANQMSRRDEEYICPNAEIPQEWVPIDYDGEDKYKLRSTTILKYTGLQKQGHFHLMTTETLKQALENAGITKDHYYAIKWVNQSVDRTDMVMMGVATSLANAKNGIWDHYVILPSTPVDALIYFFTPVEIPAEAANSEDECGYYFIPYDFIDLVNQAGGLWSIDKMDVEFTDDSYLKNMKSGFAKTMTQAATLAQENTEFVSYTPWLDDYTKQPKFK